MTSPVIRQVDGHSDELRAVRVREGDVGRRLRTRAAARLHLPDGHAHRGVCVCV